MRRVLPYILPVLLAGSMWAAPAGKPGPKSKKESPKAYQVGKASWYGKYFHGRTTASGEPYDMFQFTAAHRKLPLGTWVKVTNLHNGKFVYVRVNDRGPVPQSRIIDLSYAAAQVLGTRARGIAKVRLDVVEEPPVVADNRTARAGGVQ